MHEAEIKLRYYKYFGRHLNLQSPTLFTEKMQWIKLYDSLHQKVVCADKIAVRDVIKQKIGKDLGIPILATYDQTSLQNANILPNTIMKCNHGSGFNIVPQPDMSADWIKHKLSKYLSTDYSLRCYEAWYHYIQPKVIVEPLLSPIYEVKAWCFNGEVRFYEVYRIISDHAKTISYYDTDWKYMDWLVRTRYKMYNVTDAPKPRQLDEMYDIASELSKQFYFVRVDFILSDDRLYCEELTFTPTAGYQQLEGDGDY